MAKVRMLATGGTIASRRMGSRHVATVPGSELLARATVPADCDVSVVDAATVGSFAWQWPDLVGLLRQVAGALTEGVDGVLVTHGTDTMEEVAFLVSLLHDDPRPVVFTGAQRPFDHPAPDGLVNLTDALLIGVSPVARDRGVLLAFDGHVFAARGVTKTDTLRSAPFDAPGRGPVLRVAGGEVGVLTPAHRPPVIPVDLTQASPPRVDVVSMYVGVDDAPIRAAVAAGAAGIVLAAFGAGNANPAIVGAVRDTVASGVPVLVCSRVQAGPVLPLYGGGGGADLADAGAVFGGDLSPWQARMLLTVALIADSTAPTTLIADWLDAADRQETRG
ncbi:MAG: asparaginase [Streptosporangiales bacterium]|nr:asparaginase [Streptosporangiales bacterium]